MPNLRVTQRRSMWTGGNTSSGNASLRNRRSKPEPLNVTTTEYFFSRLRKILEIIAVQEELILSAVVQPHHRDGVEDRRKAGRFNVEVYTTISEVGEEPPRLAPT